MWKSPLGKSSGSGRKYSAEWKTQEDANNGGFVYGSSMRDTARHHGDDFIPLGISTPCNERRQRPLNWQHFPSNRNRQFPNRGYSNGNCYYQAANRHSTYSPYSGQSTKTFRDSSKERQKGPHREINIHRYINLQDFLEDPWAELIKKISQVENDEECEMTNMKAVLPGSVNTHNQIEASACSETLDDAGLSQESRNNMLEDFDILEKEDVSCMSVTNTSVNL